MSEPFVRKKCSEEAEEHIATETVRREEAGKPKVAGLDIEEPEKVDRELRGKDCWTRLRKDVWTLEWCCSTWVFSRFLIVATDVGGVQGSYDISVQTPATSRSQS